MTINRFYSDLESYLKPNKALIIYGPRRVGKTSLLKAFLENTAFKYKLDSGDNIKTHDILGSQDFDKILNYASGYELIAIDEAQRIPNIGLGLKILVDQAPGIRVIATGSSSFELLGQVGEPLTGRKTTLTLYPIAQMELQHYFNHHGPDSIGNPLHGQQRNWRRHLRHKQKRTSMDNFNPCSKRLRLGELSGEGGVGKTSK